jgi:hypothetical protein
LCRFFRRRGEEGEMKAGRLATVGIVFIAILVVSGARPESQGKPGKPPFTGQECIVFTGEPLLPHLDGKQLVEGCCPNRGPFPPYTMGLWGVLGGFDGVYDGNLFMNQYRPGRIRQYMVEFWTDELHFVVMGGVVKEDTKNKLVVDFDQNNSECDEYSSGTYKGPCMATPTFTLVRTSDLSFCDR